MEGAQAEIAFRCGRGSSGGRLASRCTGEGLKWRELGLEVHVEVWNGARAEGGWFVSRLELRPLDLSACLECTPKLCVLSSLGGGGG